MSNGYSGYLGYQLGYAVNLVDPYEPVWDDYGLHYIDHSNCDGYIEVDDMQQAVYVMGPTSHVLDHYKPFGED